MTTMIASLTAGSRGPLRRRWLSCGYGRSPAGSISRGRRGLHRDLRQDRQRAAEGLLWSSDVPNQPRGSPQGRPCGRTGWQEPEPMGRRGAGQCRQLRDSWQSGFNEIVARGSSAASPALERIPGHAVRDGIGRQRAAGSDASEVDYALVECPLLPVAGFSPLAVLYPVDRNRGSRVSRTASPKRLKAKTDTVIARPGKMAIQGALSAYSSAPPWSISPQAGVGSWTPSPR